MDYRGPAGSALQQGRGVHHQLRHTQQVRPGVRHCGFSHSLAALGLFLSSFCPLFSCFCLSVYPHPPPSVSSTHTHTHTLQREIGRERERERESLLSLFRVSFSFSTPPPLSLSLSLSPRSLSSSSLSLPSSFSMCPLHAGFVSLSVYMSVGPCLSMLLS